MTAKLLVNSVVPTPNAKFMATNLKDFYLDTPMTRCEYKCIPLWMIPAVIIEQYKLLPLVHNGLRFSQWHVVWASASLSPCQRPTQ